MKKNNYTAPSTLVMMIDTEMPIAVSPSQEETINMPVKTDETAADDAGGFAKKHFNVWEDD